MNFLKLYFIGYILDLVLGDPDYSLHPIRIIGRLIKKLEKFLYRLKNKKFAGGLLLLFSIIVVAFITYKLAQISEIFIIFFLYTTLATRALCNEGEKVYRILKEGGIERAQKELSYLVTRDTKRMSEREIIQSTLETISENAVDGVIAPMFYGILGSFFSYGGVSMGVIFPMIYKTVNTLDSMVGYKTERYIEFGYFSAKFDDVLNFIPARITGGFLIPISALILRYDYKNSIKVFFRDRLKHESPNSAHSEAAFAGALNINFGGDIYYFGQLYKKKLIGDKEQEINLEKLKMGIKLMYMTSLVGLITFSLGRGIF